jgi:hypothetical protein
MIDFFEAAAVFDEKLGMGLALVLGFQSGAFHDPTSDPSPTSSN